MRNLVFADDSKCVGCNRCIRACPIEEANTTTVKDGRPIVTINHKYCIACGACIARCQHNSRYYNDDTEQFFADLAKGTPISIFAAPAARVQIKQFGQVLAWLKSLGVKKIYDVSLGADICTWAHLRFIEKNHPQSVISQPCPAIVNYILAKRKELLPYLSPVHSPMLCTAIYMRKYENVTEKIAALSPCIAKANEFEDTGGVVGYNVTFAKLEKYIHDHNIKLPATEADFDGWESGLGAIYSTPGGLKENVEFSVGKSLRVDKSEGQRVVYKALDEFAHAKKKNLPAVFDVLNCAEGCNLGTGCAGEHDIFAINAVMDEQRKRVAEHAKRKIISKKDDEGLNFMQKLYKKFDKKLALNDFIRSYQPRMVDRQEVSDAMIKDAMRAMDKTDEISEHFDCGACGSDSCLAMARKIAKGLNKPENCIQFLFNKTGLNHRAISDWSKGNAENIMSINELMARVRGSSLSVGGNLKEVNQVFGQYEKSTQEISKVASNINMIALNAAIEAARAGEHGKAFAVVAESVRMLAAETQTATNTINDLSTSAKRKLEKVSQEMSELDKNIIDAGDRLASVADQSKRALQKLK